MIGEVGEPPLVEAAGARARRAGFPFSCDPVVGRLLAVLAAHLRGGARVLELGTGTGVGTAWIVSGLLPRTDVTVLTVEHDPLPWPPVVTGLLSLSCATVTRWRCSPRAARST